MKKKKQEMHSSKLIEELLESISDAEFEKTEKKMFLAAKIEDATKAKGWKKKDLLEKLGKKNPSVITKWFSGTNNFTVDTLIDLEHVLDIKLLDVEDKQEDVVTQYKAEVHQSESMNLTLRQIDEMVRTGVKSLDYYYPVEVNTGIYTNQHGEA